MNVNPPRHQTLSIFGISVIRFEMQQKKPGNISNKSRLRATGGLEPHGGASYFFHFIRDLVLGPNSIGYSYTKLGLLNYLLAWL